MGTLVWTCGIWLSVLGSVWQASPAPNLTDLVKRVESAAVTVLAYNKDGRLVNQGSGFFVDPNGELITCHHVLAGSCTVQVKTCEGGLYHVSRILADDPNADLARVAVDVPAGSASFLSFAQQTPAIAERVLVIGSPMGLELTVTEGIISAIRMRPGRGRVFQISASVSAGSSGSPVINMEGKVVGIAISQLSQGQNLNFAISAEHASALMLPKPSTASCSPLSGIEKTRAVNLLAKGKKYFDCGQYDGALSCLREIADGSEQFKDALLYSGICYRALGRYDKAAEIYEKAVSVDPNNVDAYLSLGLAYNRLGLGEKALEVYRRALRVDPVREDVILCLGMTYSQVGDHPSAIETYNDLVRVNPESAQGYYGLGVAYFNLGQLRQAAQAYQNAISRKPNDARAHYGLGLAFARLGDKASAQEQYGVLKTLEKGLADQLYQVVSK